MNTFGVPARHGQVEAASSERFSTMPLRYGALLACAAFAFACGSSDPTGAAAPGMPGAPAGVDPAAPGGQVPPGGDPNNPNLGVPPAGASSLGVKRLSVREYEHTLRDLFGLSELAPTNLVAERSLGFDNVGAALGMTEAQFEGFLRAAESTLAQVLGDETLALQALACPGALPASRDCAAAVLTEFLPRAWRRPIAPAEAQPLLALFDGALARGLTFADAMNDVFVAALNSPKFLFRFDNASGCPTAAQPLDAYALAARLSYTLWSSTPDAALTAQAASGALLQQPVLLGEVDRMLDDPDKGARFVDSFAGQWLSLEALQSHTVDAAVFPDFTEQLRAAMIEEMRVYFREFLAPARPWSEFLTAPSQYEDAVLREHYDDQPRSGFLQLAGFLALNSKPGESAPTKRAKTVMSQLLCTHLEVPADLQDEVQAAIALADTEETTARERLEVHRADASCAGCHAILDPIGLGLENYDGIGRYRTEYENGLAIDASGVFEGQAFTGPEGLARIVAADPRLDSCLAETLFVYGMGRGITAADATALQGIKDAWPAGQGGVRGLIHTLVSSDAFRNYQATDTE